MLIYLLLTLFSIISYSTPLTNWTFRIPNRTGWATANVPSTVHLDLLDHKIISDPYFRSNIMDLYWIQTQDVVYSTTFSASPQILSSLNQFIVFQGLDTHCDIILNNQTILHANNMFRKWKVPVKLQQTNNLTVYFYSSVNYDLQQEKKLFDEYKIKLPANYSFSRKAAYQYGWDWGPRLVTAGIWKNVYLEAYNYTYLDNIYVKHPPVTDTTTKIKLEIELEFKDLNPQSTYKIQSSFTDNLAQSVHHQIAKPKTSNLTFTYEVEAKNVKLWWTQDIGNPQLYTLTTKVYQNGQYLFNKTQRFGIRTVTVSQVKDTLGTSFTVVLNGKQIFMRGGNYIPVDMFMPRALKNPKVYDQIIESSLFANYNMLRIWGGGQFQFDLFYDKCDEAGILIWHDLMFACAMYPGSQDIYKNIEQQMIDNLVRLRNHPSIALWNGNNQVWIGWQEWGWKSGKTKDQIDLIESWYNRIFKVVLPQTISKYDQNRFYWETSPSSSSNTLTNINSGDIHFWQVWGAGANIQLYSSYTGRFNSQYGMQSMLQYNSILKFTAQSDRQINSYVMRLHERHIYGDVYLPMYVEDYVGTSSNSSSLKSFAYLSQVMQSYALKTAIDALRTTPSCMGSLYWQLNDVWPVSSWSTIDYYGVYKAAHYMARDSYQLVYATMVLRNNSYLVYVVNDDIKTISGTLKYTILDFSGNTLKPTIQKSYFMAAGRRTLSQTISKQDMNKYIKNYRNSYVKIQFESEKSLTNIYYFGRPSSTQNKSPSLKMTQQGNKLTVSSDVLARWVYIYRKDGVSLKLKNNYFDVLAQSNVTVELPEGVSLDQIDVMEYYTETNRNPKLSTVDE